ncbi:MAG: VWA domain-containing protein [Planctomycetes bacterium]|nr:VWA domain-containing protein [Planctomycetota bacterium]
MRVTRWFPRCLCVLLSVGAVLGGRIAAGGAPSVGARQQDAGRRVQFVGPMTVEELRNGDWQLKFAVRVTEADGVPCRHLARDAFRVLLDGSDVASRARKEDFGRAHVGSEPLRLVLVVDASTGLWPVYAAKLLPQVTAFIGKVAERKGDELGLVVVRESEREAVEPTTDHEAVRRRVPEAAESGGQSTPLHEALLRACQMMPRAAFRKAIVVFSDGKDEGSAADLGVAIKAAQEANCPVFVVAIGNVADGRAMVEQEDCEKVAELTGGRVFPGGASAEALYQAVVEATNPDYTWELVLAKGALARDGIRRRLTVAVVSHLQLAHSGHVRIEDATPLARMPFAVNPRTWWQVWWVWVCIGGVALVVLMAVAAIILATRSRGPRVPAVATPPPTGEPDTGERPGECPMCGQPMEADEAVCPNPACRWVKGEEEVVLVVSPTP